MTLEPGSSAYNNALDRYITGNYGADQEEGLSSDDFHNRAEDRMRDDLVPIVRSLMRDTDAWTAMIEESGLNDDDATRVYAITVQPHRGNEEHAEIQKSFEKAVAAYVEFFEHIAMDTHKVTELARDLEDDWKYN